MRYYSHVPGLVWENTLYSLLNTLLFRIIIALAASIVAGYLCPTACCPHIGHGRKGARHIALNMAMRLDNEHTRGEPRTLP